MLKVHSPVELDDDSMTNSMAMCLNKSQDENGLPNSQDDDTMMMCLSNSHDDVRMTMRSKTVEHVYTPA